MEVIEGTLRASGKRFAIVAGRWNSSVTDRLIESAIQTILDHGGDRTGITVVRVPGSFEIPVTCQELARSKRFSGIIALGTLVQGETDHYRLVADQLSAGLAKVMLETSIPVTFGVIATSQVQQAVKRSQIEGDNKGREAALAAIELADVLAKISKLSN